MTITITPDVTSISRSTVISLSSDAGAITVINGTFGSQTSVVMWTNGGGFMAGFAGTQDGPKENITISKIAGWDANFTNVFASAPVVNRQYIVVVPTDITVLSKTLMRTILSEAVVVDAAYLDPSNYSLTTTTGAGPDIVGVLPHDDTASLSIVLVTNAMIEGTTYTLSFSGLSLRTGLELSIVGDFIARPTKLDSLLRSIPNHYDTRSGSNLHVFLTAVGISDDLIGGSLNDSITFD